MGRGRPPQHVAGSEVPGAESAALGPGKEAAPGLGETDAANGAGVPLELAQLRARLRVEHADNWVFTTGSDEAAVAAVGSRVGLTAEFGDSVLGVEGVPVQDIDVGGGCHGEVVGGYGVEAEGGDRGRLLLVGDALVLRPVAGFGTGIGI